MDLLITTGCGYPIQGGADMWVNHFLKEIYPIISKSDDYIVLVDGRKPTDWNNEGIEDIPIHFYFKDTKRSVELLKTCNRIHFLHAHYHTRKHLLPYQEKFSTIYVHAYPPDMVNLDKTKTQLSTRVVADEFKKLVGKCKKKVWIGVSKNSSLFKDFDDITLIPNFYEFKHNIPFKKIKTGKIGFTARCESRKNAEFLRHKQGYILTNKYDWLNLKQTDDAYLNRIKFYQWDSKILDSFMRLPWDISHSCHRNEPFGYSIFQAVDYGKLPIIHTDWAPELDYKYKANSHDTFVDVYWNILSDSVDSQKTIVKEFKKLKEFMLNFNSLYFWRVKNVKVFTFS